MAYARWDKDCDWYIFWHSAKGDEEKSSGEEWIALWHKDSRSELPVFSYTEVCKMLHDSDFSAIPNFGESQKKLIHDCLSKFVKDVDAARE